MDAEQNSIATYYQLINITYDVDIIEVLGFLGQRETTIYKRFLETLMNVYDPEESKHTF
ncbi:hypothetical protein [Romboutsia sp. 1001713B170131_170501_G6]|uniref:hypothetical protein n=1 Tax=Romboutsia sp. 1001713B170131_170501_G6 TaxID=2787108 RepID=UPI0018ABAC15|nr:hypothetical protein [Romboutsia sp. 1001713B170131_170501_G6]